MGHCEHAGRAPALSGCFAFDSVDQIHTPAATSQGMSCGCLREMPAHRNPALVLPFTQGLEQGRAGSLESRITAYLC